MKNKEGYTDNTAECAVKNASRMPHRIHEVFQALNMVARLSGVEIIAVRDKSTKKEYYK